MANELLNDKALSFAIRCVNLYKELRTKRDDYILCKQMLRSGTSIGANISESTNAQSDMDYVSKLSIALKEADETYYWFKLLKRTDYINDNEYISLEKDVKELIAMLTTLIKNKKKNINEATKQ